LVSTLLLCEHTSSKFWMADLVKTDATKTTTDKDKKLSKTKGDRQRDRKTHKQKKEIGGRLQGIFYTKLNDKQKNI